MANENAAVLQADVNFKALDFLAPEAQQSLGQYDLIVSNPPYIPAAESETMDPNVRDHEPHTALFVPDNDPLLFYRAIAGFGKTHLKKGGAIYCELHKDFALTTEALFKETGYTETDLKKDINGHWRMLKSTL